jgi:hypothetical protein
LFMPKICCPPDPNICIIICLHRLFMYPGYGSSGFLWNIVTFLLKTAVAHPRSWLQEFSSFFKIVWQDLYFTAGRYVNTKCNT